MKSKHLSLLEKAQALERSGKTLEAATAYRCFLEREPRHGATWSDFAGQLMHLGLFNEALKACETALELDPANLSARINQSCILMRQGSLDAAKGQLQDLLKVAAGRMDAQLALAECLLRQKDLRHAHEVLMEAARPGVMTGRYAVLQPRHGEMWAILGLSLLEERRFGEAEEACETSLRLDPLNFRARANLGSIQLNAGRLQEAEDQFQRLVSDHPQEELGRLLLITCLTRKGDLALADQEIVKVIQQASSSFAVHKSVAGTYYSRGRWTEYKAELDRFRRVDPTSAYVEYEQSFVDLLFGDMPRGWERFEARKNIPKELRPQRSLATAQWEGENFAGKTLLLWAEQGFGDTLMFLRYLQLVKARGGRVILEVQPELLEVAATCEGLDAVISTGSVLPPFDIQASLMSLPWVFQTDLSSIPAGIPYLDVPEAVPHRQELLNCLSVAKDAVRIGLVWAGRPTHGRDAERSLPVTTLAPLSALSGVSWFSFQVGQQEVPSLPDLVSLTPFLGDFSDTAYALSGLDLMITVDTSVAHLAGALGIPTLLLLSYAPDYRWLLDRRDSPWYPTMRLYRQPAYGDWESVVQRILEDLAQGT